MTQPVLELGDYEVILQKGGFYCIRQKSSGETMHSVIEPAQEAKSLYVNQSGLDTETLNAEKEPYVIWDVGLGAATNAVYTLLAYEESLADPPNRRALSLVSFEKDLSPLRLAFLHPDKFRHVTHPSVEVILKQDRWTSDTGKIQWQLFTGDFLDMMQQAPRAHCIYFDPFSRKADAALWSDVVFKRIFSCCAPEGARLISYSVSTPVRRAMLDAGFILGIGAPSGPKAETTIAYSSPEAAKGKRLFPEEKIIKWRGDASQA